MDYTFIGDIHSAADDLQILLDDSVIKKTRLVFMGDYIDGVTTRHFSNHTETMKNDPLAVLDILMERVNRHGDIALLGNHDDFWVQTVRGDDYQFQLWRANGGAHTWRKLGIHSSMEMVVRTSLTQGVLKPYTQFLEQLPLYWSNDYMLAVHAGLYWHQHDFSQQTRDDLLWIREPYYYENELHPDQWHKNLLNKVIITGHTPVQSLQQPNAGYIKMQANVHDTPRYLIDSGSRSGAFDGGIPALTFDDKGNLLQSKRVIKQQLYDGDQILNENELAD
ncbi:metallophosphoesterase [Furfurilactobacillus rossiae]|uniref:Calcineurin-like phosphoesterase domain-containing protein n=1 Tax=Furfurilactobacillus rossiae DSM 15814 TaxID=1114972 RepID=A0A0R1RH43_9LACO|nr:metallophosphoesterase [Furfurilactobacillus rossiae]KRL55841.1 hypothetical protein FD35_GL002373 [Furfurilactobacillus rossiae DSM 15814]QFR67213.1 serine/threonine protein phosphatase [Furfurilactobacillus rossiae]QLE60137.1 Diadenosine tetraphosphatase related serine-threonine protein phosphatase [Furfurilactobacillus rossiae]